jgi:hypothetical protein
MTETSMVPSPRSDVSVAALAIVVCAALSACSASNNPLLGRVEATVADHEVVVTGCYRMSVPDVKSTDDGDSFAPCKESSVAIKRDMLYVNGESYGQLGKGDRVLVDHGKVAIEPR